AGLRPVEQFAIELVSVVVVEHRVDRRATHLVGLDALAVALNGGGRPDPDAMMVATDLAVRNLHDDRADVQAKEEVGRAAVAERPAVAAAEDSALERVEIEEERVVVEARGHLAAARQAHIVAGPAAA